MLLFTKLRLLLKLSQPSSDTTTMYPQETTPNRCNLGRGTTGSETLRSCLLLFVIEIPAAASAAASVGAAPQNNISPLFVRNLLVVVIVVVVNVVIFVVVVVVVVVVVIVVVIIIAVVVAVAVVVVVVVVVIVVVVVVIVVVIIVAVVVAVAVDIVVIVVVVAIVNHVLREQQSCKTVSPYFSRQNDLRRKFWR